MPCGLPGSAIIRPVPLAMVHGMWVVTSWTGCSSASITLTRWTTAFVRVDTSRRSDDDCRRNDSFDAEDRAARLDVLLSDPLEAVVPADPVATSTRTCSRS